MQHDDMPIILKTKKKSCKKTFHPVSGDLTKTCLNYAFTEFSPDVTCKIEQMLVYSPFSLFGVELCP